jgi:hypothetical protein
MYVRFALKTWKYYNAKEVICMSKKAENSEFREHCLSIYLSIYLYIDI